MRYEIPSEGEPLPSNPEIEERVWESASEMSTHLQGLIEQNLIDKDVTKNWPNFSQDSRYQEQAWESESGVEAVIAAAFYGIVGALNDQEKISSIRRDIGRQTGTNQREFGRRIHDTAVHAAAWQQNVVLMIMALKDSTRGQEVLADFWDRAETIYNLRYPQQSSRRPEQSEGDVLLTAHRNGILAIATTCQLLQALEIDSQLPTPEQDVRDKIDLFAWARGNPKHVFALQIKSGAGVPTTREKEARPHRARQKQRLIIACERYSRQLGRWVIPLMVNIESPETGMVDRTTGAPTDILIARHAKRGLGKVMKTSSSS